MKHCHVTNVIAAVSFLVSIQSGHVCNFTRANFTCNFTNDINSNLKLRFRKFIWFTLSSMEILGTKHNFKQSLLVVTWYNWSNKTSNRCASIASIFSWPILLEIQQAAGQTTIQRVSAKKQLDIFLFLCTHRPDSLFA